MASGQTPVGPVPAPAGPQRLRKVSLRSALAGRPLPVRHGPVVCQLRHRHHHSNLRFPASERRAPGPAAVAPGGGGLSVLLPRATSAEGDTVSVIPERLFPVPANWFVADTGLPESIGCPVQHR
jgi:hypothetical protein